MKSEEARDDGRFARSSASVLAATIISSALSFVFVLLVARVSGRTTRGALAFLTAAPTLLSFASALGLDAANLYFAGRDPGRRARLVAATLAVGPASGAALAGIAFVVFTAVPGWVPGGVSTPLLALSLATTPLMSIQYLLLSALIGSGEIRAANRVRVSMPAGTLLVFGVSAAVSGEATLTVAIVSWCAGQALGSALALAESLRRLGVDRDELAGGVRAVLRYGLPAHAGSLADIATFRVDSLILAGTAGASELGAYAAAVNVAEVLLYLPTSVSAVLLASGAARPGAEAESLARRALVPVTLLAAMGALVGIVAAPWLVRTLFGDEFRSAAAPLRILLVAMLGMSVRRVLWAGLAARRRQAAASTVAIVTLGVVVALDLILIPRHGGVGAAWASLGGYWLGGALMLGTFGRTEGRERRERAGFRSDLRASATALIAILRRPGPD